MYCSYLSVCPVGTIGNLILSYLPDLISIVGVFAVKEKKTRKSMDLYDLGLAATYESGQVGTSAIH